MKVAVITPIHSARQEWLETCLASVQAQTHPCTHIVVTDGIAKPPLPDFAGQYIALERTHADFGDTPRAIGSMSAISQGFDAIAYLDDDNWYHPQHIETLVALHRRTGADVCSSARFHHSLDGHLLFRCTESGVGFVDTSCYFLARSAFALCAQWALMPTRFHPICDRYIFHAAHYLSLRHAQSEFASLHYRNHLIGCYLSAGLKPPAEARHPCWNHSLLHDLQAHFASGQWLRHGTVPVQISKGGGALP